MDHIYWRDCDVTTLPDRGLVDLAAQLDALTRNDRVVSIPELATRVGARLALVLREIEVRGEQLSLL